MANCANCGAELIPGLKYCSVCGAPANLKRDPNKPFYGLTQYGKQIPPMPDVPAGAYARIPVQQETYPQQNPYLQQVRQSPPPAQQPGYGSVPGQGVPIHQAQIYGQSPVQPAPYGQPSAYPPPPQQAAPQPRQAAQYPQQTVPQSSASTENPSMTTWLLWIFLAFLPVANVVLLLIWGFSSDTTPLKRNWARAMLIMIAVVFGIWLVWLAVSAAMRPYETLFY